MLAMYPRESWERLLKHSKMVKWRIVDAGDASSRAIENSREESRRANDFMCSRSVKTDRNR